MRYVYPFVSMTTVQRASTALTKTNIPHKVVELDADITKKGCAFGIEVPRRYLDFAENTMRQAGIRYKEHVEL